MKIIISFFTIALLALFSCTTPTGSTSGGGSSGGTTAAKATHISASALKGVYLTGSATVSRSVARSVTARDIIASSGASLGGIATDGTPTPIVFQDGNGNTVTATVSQALQLSATYLLLDYTVNATTTTAALNVTTGALASLNTPPDNWSGVYTVGASAWYEAGGSIVRASLDTGSPTVLSAGSLTYSSTGVGGENNVSNGVVTNWPSDATIYVDSNLTAYVVQATNSQSIKGMAIFANGATVDFGKDQGDVRVLGLFGSGIQAHSLQTTVDPTTQKPYFISGTDEWDGNPMNAGGSTITGYRVQILPVTFDASADPVVNFAGSTGNAVPLAAVHLCNGNGTTYDYPTSQISHFGPGLSSSDTVFSDGPKTLGVSFSGGVPSITMYDTSAIPAAGSIGYPSNFVYSGGNLYFGPSASQTIGIVTLGNPSTATTLVTGVGTIQAWAIVGGVLFWVDDSGSWKAPVNGSTLGQAVQWTGGTVTAITQ